MAPRSIRRALTALVLTLGLAPIASAKPVRPPAPTSPAPSPPAPPRPTPPRASQIVDATSGQGLTVVRRGVLSTSNANDAYVAVVELTAQPTTGPALILGGQRLVARSWGSGFGQGQGSASWEVDRATADAIAAAWQVTRQDRVSLDPGLTLRCRPKQASFRRGKPMPMVLELVNAGATTVGFQDGGRQFGRDEQFAFTATRGNVALPVIPLGPAAGGGGFQYKLIAPGQKVQLAAELTGWIKPTKPGRHKVGCEYRTALVPGTRGPQWPERGAEVWDLTLTATTAVVVK